MRAGAGIQVEGIEDLVQQIAGVLSNPDGAQGLGKRGREEILRHVGSARKDAELLAKHLSTSQMV